MQPVTSSQDISHSRVLIHDHSEICLNAWRSPGRDLGLHVTLGLEGIIVDLEGYRRLLAPDVPRHPHISYHKSWNPAQYNPRA